MGHTIDQTAADGHKLSAYVAGPNEAKKGPVVIQEIFGLNRHIRNVVDCFWSRRGNDDPPGGGTSGRASCDHSSTPRRVLTFF